MIGKPVEHFTGIRTAIERSDAHTPTCRSAFLYLCNDALHTQGCRTIYGISLLTKSPDLNTIIADRTLDRAKSEDIEEWEKTLKKKERENPITTEVKSDPKIVWGTIIGYNKKTKEFLVSGASRKPVWLTEKELGKIEQQTYTVRF